MMSMGLSRGDYEEVERLSLAGLELCRKFNAPGWEGTILAGYMFLLNWSGRWDEARKHGERVLPLFERVGCSACFMFIFRNLAEIEAKRGDRERSRQYMNSAHDIASQFSQLLPEPDADIRWKFFDLVIHEEWDAAWNSVEEYRAAGYPLLSTTSTSKSSWSLMLPETAARAKHWPEAEHLAREAIIMFEGIGAKAGVANSHFALGLMHAGQQKLDEALAEFQQALEGYQSLGHPWDTANTKYEMGLVHAARGGDGDKDQARRSFEAALTAFSSLGAKPGAEKVEIELRKLK
jgi:tetratricopeptide (TPR) repeat protein